MHALLGNHMEFYHCSVRFGKSSLRINLSSSYVCYHEYIDSTHTNLNFAIVNISNLRIMFIYCGIILHNDHLSFSLIKHVLIKHVLIRRMFSSKCEWVLRT
jgi:hypothetical protein